MNLALTLTLALLVPALAQAIVDSPSELLRSVKQELEHAYPGAQIELLGQPNFLQKPTAISEVKLVQDTGRGEARVVAITPEGSIQGLIAFRALVNAAVPSRRIHYGEALNLNDVKEVQLNVANGLNHEVRGLIVSRETIARGGLEARQTLMEGQAVLSSALIKRPDIKKGEPVRVRMFSGDVTLTLSAIAEESGYRGTALRVMTLKNKKIMMGKLDKDGTVEVRL